MQIDIQRAGTTPRLDDRPIEKRIGLVILATDHTTEVDFQRMVASERIGLYTARIAYANPTTPENLKRMQPRLSEGASLILPDEPLDAICYSCNSASVVIGDAAVAAAIEAAKPGVPVVTPPLAAVAGLKALGVRRISVLTPYTVETSRPMAAYFAGHGFDIARFTCLGFDDDRAMARIGPASLVEAAVEATAADSDALFIACTALRAAGAVPAIERAIGRPVVSSNLATAWQCLGLCGETAPRPESGRLMSLLGRTADTPDPSPQGRGSLAVAPDGHGEGSP
ncbi:ectoine utilization protein EutA [Chelatococcus sp. GCM10030263]|uniref:ectoine utilization protein EutA n=1 Tax=Chelatococcus sp. GCM10030263 TaxID=3273387 RepID=UPI00360E1D30